METVAIIATILKEAPAAIEGVEALLGWGADYWRDLKTAFNIDEATLTPEILASHIANFKRSSGLIQRT